MAWMACGMKVNPWDVIRDANCWWLAIAAAMAAPNPGGYGSPAALPSLEIGIMVRAASTMRKKNDK